MRHIIVTCLKQFIWGSRLRPTGEETKNHLCLRENKFEQTRRKLGQIEAKTQF